MANHRTKGMEELKEENDDEEEHEKVGKKL